MRDASAPCVVCTASAAAAPNGKHRAAASKTLFFMRGRFPLLILLALAVFACSGFATAAWAAEPTHATAEEHHSLPLKPDVLFEIGHLAVTNSMVVTWIVAAGIIICAQLATRKIKPVPTGLQNFWEWLVESLYNFLENMIGRDLVKKTFWFFATIFIFILFLNWFGLIPGVGTIGWGHNDAAGVFHIHRPLFRGANANLNLTFAMASVFFICWIVWAVQTNIPKPRRASVVVDAFRGSVGVIKHLFGPKGKTSGFLKILMIFIFFVVGWLEVVSILFRPISLSFRLFGNIYAGEIMLESMSHIVPSLAWLIPIPFYFLELLVGFVQALVFMLLTAVFTLLIAQHDEPGHGEAAHH
jgi:F-type H+-transporting ATPase subunit a